MLLICPTWSCRLVLLSSTQFVRNWVCLFQWHESQLQQPFKHASGMLAMVIAASEAQSCR